MSETFSDLPDALVRDLLAIAIPVANEVREHLAALNGQSEGLRRTANANGLIRRKADLDVPREPSVAGIDGSYQIHRLTSMDLCAAAAVAIEGTTKEARRYWPEPFHEMWATTLPHDQETTGALRGIMVGMELSLARSAPHDVVLLDGSFGSLIIYLNQGLSSMSSVGRPLADELLRSCENGLIANLSALLLSERTIAVPKFTSRNELTGAGGLSLDIAIDGRTMATLILEAGEYTSPLPIYEDDPDYHLPKAFADQTTQEKINAALNGMRAVYFRPYRWVPALRLELPASLANSRTRLSIALEGIARQFFSPAVLEPYPLFLADRMVKSLGAGVSVIEQTMAQHVMDTSLNSELAMLFLQNYRTEGGRGGF